MRVSKKIRVTEELVNSFSELSGDKNPIHIDELYAKNTTFGKRIAHGALLGSFISSLISSDYPGEGSIYLSQEYKFIKPCFIDDIIEVVIQLIEKKGNRYLLSTNVYKEENLIVEGTAVIMKKQEDPKVSVVIPCYKFSKYIEKCIESVLSQQTNFYFEVLILDDY